MLRAVFLCFCVYLQRFFFTLFKTREHLLKGIYTWKIYMNSIPPFQSYYSLFIKIGYYYSVTKWKKHSHRSFIIKENEIKFKGEKQILFAVSSSFLRFWERVKNKMLKFYQKLLELRIKSTKIRKIFPKVKFWWISRHSNAIRVMHYATVEFFKSENITKSIKQIIKWTKHKNL